MGRRARPLNWFEKILTPVAPGWAYRHYMDRVALEIVSGNGYSGAKKDRLSKDRDNLGGDGNRHMDAGTLWTLRENSRELDRNNGLAIGVIDRRVENILGAQGFDLIPNTGSDDLSRLLIDDWQSWLLRCDFTGEWHGWQLFQKLFRTADIDGDIWVQLDDLANDGNGALRYFEGDRVLTPARATGIDGLKLTHGVAVDRDGRRRWLWVANESPLTPYVQADKGRVIDARQCLQLRSMERRLTKVRGTPILAPIIRDMDDLDDLLLFERIGAKLVAAQGYFIETDDPIASARAMSQPDEDSSSIERTEEVVPGAIHYLKRGCKPHSLQSNRPSPVFEAFVRLLNRMIGLPLGLPYELVMLDFGQVNFASSRQLLNQAQRRFLKEQFEFGCFLSKIYAWWLSNRIRRGFYDRYSDAVLSRRIYLHQWGTPGWPSPNPLQDAQAAAIGLEWEFESRTAFNRRRGVRQADIFSELAAERPNVQQYQSLIVSRDRSDVDAESAVRHDALAFIQRMQAADGAERWSDSSVQQLRRLRSELSGLLNQVSQRLLSKLGTEADDEDQSDESEGRS